MSSDDLLLERALVAGDAGAFERLFREHHAPLTAFARRYLGTSEAAEEVVQEVFLQVWNKRLQLRFRMSARAYLYRAVRNRSLNVLDRRRVAGRFRRLLARTEPMPVAEPAAAQEDRGTEALLSALEGVVKTLPPRTRLAVTLRYYQGLSQRDAAAAMGISEKGVERLIGIALGKLRAALRGRDVGEPVADLSDSA